MVTGTFSGPPPCPHSQPLPVPSSLPNHRNASLYVPGLHLQRPVICCRLFLYECSMPNDISPRQAVLEKIWNSKGHRDVWILMADDSAARATDIGPELFKEAETCRQFNADLAGRLEEMSKEVNRVHACVDQFACGEETWPISLACLPVLRVRLFRQIPSDPWGILDGCAGQRRYATDRRPSAWVCACCARYQRRDRRGHKSQRRRRGTSGASGSRRQPSHL